MSRIMAHAVALSWSVGLIQTRAIYALDFTNEAHEDVSGLGYHLKSC